MCPTFCNQIDCSTTVFPAHHQITEPTQTHVHCISDAMQPSHPLTAPTPTFNFLSIRVFSIESFLRMRWPKYWSLSFSISPFNGYSGVFIITSEFYNSCFYDVKSASLYFSLMMPFNFSWKAGLVMLNSLRFCLLGNTFISISFTKFSFAKPSILGWYFFLSLCWIYHLTLSWPSVFL